MSVDSRVATADEWVRYVSASWCKRCHELKPQVVSTCQLLELPVEFVNYDDLDEAESATITSLPTLFHHTDPDNRERCVMVRALEIEGWIAKMMSRPLQSTDF